LSSPAVEGKKKKKKLTRYQRNSGSRRGQRSDGKGQGVAECGENRRREIPGLLTTTGDLGPPRGQTERKIGGAREKKLKGEGRERVKGCKRKTSSKTGLSTVIKRKRGSSWGENREEGKNRGKPYIYRFSPKTLGDPAVLKD